MHLPALPPELAHPDLSDREFLERAKEFFRETHRSLREDQRSCLCGGIAACRRYSDAVDAVVSALHDRGRARFLSSTADMNYRCTVIAVGGYGRGELCPKSDVDLLFLYGYKVDWYTEAITESILYPLWDLGFEVGHSVRNIKETIRLALSDGLIRSSLLDYRYVAGDRELLARDSRELDKLLYYTDGDRFIDGKIAEMNARREKAGSTVYLLEPNIKDGCGGLRDLQTAVWAARVKYKCRDLKELQRKGAIDARTAEAVRHVSDFLLRVRNELHYALGKKSDVLSFGAQEELAGRLGYRKLGASFGVERFMRSYYLHAASADQLTKTILEEVGRPLEKEGVRKLFSFSMTRRIWKEGILYKGKLQVKDGAAFEKSPIRILEFFRTLQKTKAQLSLQAKMIIQGALPVIGEEFRSSREAARLFLEILSDPAHLRETLLAMNESLFLGRYIPEFAPLHCRVLRDVYHVYTADVHSIRCAGVLAAISASSQQTWEEKYFLDIFEKIPNKALLTLAILLHDIGKGQPGQGHSITGARIVERIGARWGFTQDEISELAFLVEHHLLMAHVSQRRDLHDIEMILSFADTVGAVERLDKLYLLTYADLKEVGPEVWTQWKATLLKELYEKARNVLEQGALKSPPEESAELKRARVLERLKEEEAEAAARFLHRMDDAYIISTSEARIANRCRILERFDGKTPIVEALDIPETGVSEIVIICPDERGIFAKIAGVLSSNGVNILNASVSTTLDAAAVDTFYVNFRGKSLEGQPKKKRVMDDLMRVLEGKLSVESLIAAPRVGKFFREKAPQYRPTRVNFDNSSSSRYTVVDIFTYDRIGLLYDITRTLTSLGIDIHLSKISTKADQAADAFYVSERNAGKITDPKRLEAIREAILESIGL